MTPQKPYNNLMRIKFRETFLGHPEAGLFVLEADFLLRRYILRDRSDEDDNYFLLGGDLGLMTNCEVIDLMTQSISRMIIAKPHSSRIDNYWERETLIKLYNSYACRFLANLTEAPKHPSLVLCWLIDWLVDKHAARTLRLCYSDLSYADWALIVNLGAMLLQKEFPPVAKGRRLKIAAHEKGGSVRLEDWASELRAWLPWCSLSLSS